MTNRSPGLSGTATGSWYCGSIWIDWSSQIAWGTSWSPHEKTDFRILSCPPILIIRTYQYCLKWLITHALQIGITYLHCHSEAKILLIVQRDFPPCATQGWSVQYPLATPGHRLPLEHRLVFVISAALEFLVHKETHYFFLRNWIQFVIRLFFGAFFPLILPGSYKLVLPTGKGIPLSLKHYEF